MKYRDMDKYKYDSFVLHYEQYKIVETLSLNYEQKGMLLDAIFTYAKDGTIPANTPDLVRGAFAGIKVRMDEDRAKYQAKKDRMEKINNQKRDEIARNRNEVVTESHENGGVTDTDTDTDTDSVSDSVVLHTPTPLPPRGENGGVRPSLSEIQEYIDQQKSEGKEGYTFTAEEFYEEMEVNGWLNKKGQPITKNNWKYVVNGWARYRASTGKAKTTGSSRPVRFDNEKTDYKNDEL